jgi:predicted house-cleaning noncanonical NTP pyrophosphatase (MazG superfamily)
MKRKLVRDNYLDTIKDAKVYCEPDKVDQHNLLQEKLHEELLELAQSCFKDVKEYADVIEVLYSLAYLEGIQVEDINAARHLKLQTHGGFSKGVVLEE